MLLGIGVVMLVGLGGLFVYNSMVTAGPTRTDDREPKTWVLRAGQTLSLRSDEVHPDDDYRCTGKGGVDGTPPPGTGVSNSAGLTVATDADGTVTATCEPGPPGNV
jgi:hypothetical protein